MLPDGFRQYSNAERAILVQICALIIQLKTIRCLRGCAMELEWGRSFPSVPFPHWMKPWKMKYTRIKGK